MSAASWSAPASSRRNTALHRVAVLTRLLARCRSPSSSMNAFKSPEDFLMGTGLRLPSRFNLFDNIARAWAKGLSAGFVNSLIYGLVASVGAVVLAALAAYGIVRLKIPRGLFWFLLIYSGTIFPFQMYLIPLFNMYLETGLYDSGSA